MEKQKNLAIDATIDNWNTAKAYSRMIMEIFGDETFSIKELENALKFISKFEPSSVLILRHKYKLPGTYKHLNYNSRKLSIAKETLIFSNKVFNFLTSSKIESLKKEIETLDSLDKKVKRNSLLFKDWEISLKNIFNSFLEKNGNSIELRKIVHRIENALTHKNIFTINDLSNYCENKLSKIPESSKIRSSTIEDQRMYVIMQIRNIGEESIKILKKILAEHDFNIA